MPTVSDRRIFAWWNTSLSPRGRNRTSASDLAIATDIVKYLLTELHVDCLALGEVSKQNLQHLHGELSRNYKVYDGTLREGRVQFDTGAIFNSQRLTLVDHMTTTEMHGTRLLRLANRIDFLLPDDPRPFHVFLLHWPSHIIPDSGPLRTFLGARLRTTVEAVMDKYNGDARLIIMGDFNEEPFHESLEGQLLATRDRTLAKKNPSYLYNPFWRHLGESEPYTHILTRYSFAGTCFIATGHSTKWKTVDQILVSSAFLGRSSWHLNEDYTQVLPITPLATQRGLGGGIFDHFPVCATIEKVLHKEN